MCSKCETKCPCVDCEQKREADKVIPVEDDSFAAFLGYD